MERPLLGVFFITILHGVGCGLHTDPRYKISNRPCIRDSECWQELGEICWWLYNGCNTGHCMCPPSTHTADANGRCLLIKLGNEECHPGDRCPKEMACLNGTCQCLEGTMHSGEQFCILPRERLLGQACDPSRDKCFHKVSYGFSSQEVQCGASGLCECLHGYKREHNTCRRLHIGESGCSKTFHCEGGAICADGSCQCPSGYRAVAGGTKCAKHGAVKELPVGHRCDEFNELSYCAKGLVCHMCSRDTHYTCVRYQYLNYEGDRQALSSSAPSGPSVFLPAALLMLLFFCQESARR